MSRDRILRDVQAEFLSGVGVPSNEHFVIDTFQKEAIDHLVQGHDTLVVAPTGSGKTYIAVSAIEAALQMGGRAIYTTPLKALSNTKFTDFKARFEPKYSVGLLTGDRKISGDANVVVATTEIFRNELYNFSERYSLVVLDEVHFLADQQRGPVWEESIILAPASSTLLMLSASISNPEEIAEWLLQVRGKECKIVMKKERPVELRLGFLHPEFGPLPLYDKQGRVVREVSEYYASYSMDQRGFRLRGGRDRGSRGRGSSRRYRGR
jgi:ATP-dependent RNA helicase HelY